MFALVIVAMTGAAILQIVAPEYMGSNAAYGISTGWQREIGFWNLAVLIILVTTCFHYDWVYLRAILLALILGGIGIGTNHFIHFFERSRVGKFSRSYRELRSCSWLDDRLEARM